MSQYAIPVNDKTADLVMFLNDGFHPRIHVPEEGTYYLVFEINGPREITSKIMSEDELYDDRGYAKTPINFLL